MDSNRIKNLATGVREMLRSEVATRLDSVLAKGSRESLEDRARVRVISEDIRVHGRDEVIDRAAYTWFNRLCALRFMDANGYTPTLVVTPKVGSTQPAILADASRGIFDPELEIPDVVKRQIISLLMGVSTTPNAAEEAYSLLLQSVCAHYAGPMSYLFAEDVASSLLIPGNLLSQGSILGKIVDEMDDETCSSVEVLGWLYQFYIAEKKAAYFSSGKRATASDIPAATELFTPRWIVEFLTDNSLGLLWMQNNPESDLVTTMKYYVSPVNDYPYIEINTADEIRVLDPACGSGHILVYAFDLLFKMYEEEGWPAEDIPEMILRNNLYGLEVDRRAAEIASFALEMKAREKDPSFFQRSIYANIHVLEPVVLDAQELLLVPELAKRKEFLSAMAHMDELGSLYVPDDLDRKIIDHELENLQRDGNLFAESIIAKMQIMIANLNSLSGYFHCTIANPPYLLRRNAPTTLANYMSANYQGVETDTCTCFIELCRKRLYKLGIAALITMDSWLALNSYTNFREELIQEQSVALFAHLGAGAFPSIGGSVVSVVASVFRNECMVLRPQAIDLTLYGASEQKNEALLSAISQNELRSFSPQDLTQIESSPFTGAFLNESAIDALRESEPLRHLLTIKQGIKTGQNDIFLRLWYEVGSKSESMWNGEKWFPITKGGQFRKWYGNNEYVVNWENDGYEIRNFKDEDGRLRSRPQNLQYMFREGLTYTNVSDVLSVRYCPEGFLFDATGSMMFCEDHSLLLECLGYLLSTTAGVYSHILSPKMTVEVGQMNLLPILSFEQEEIENLVNENIEICRLDWDSFETSWDFVRHPMTCVLDGKQEKLTDCYARWQKQCRDRFSQLKANEEKLNHLFAHIYGLEDEVAIKVPEDKVSVRLANRSNDARSLISYIVGCIFGRYSWECGKLMIANQGETVDDYCSRLRDAGEDHFFIPDTDNVLPVLADEWFGDDIVTNVRQWLAYVYGDDELEKNVRWIEESIGKDLRTYFARNFYADHVKAYQKRPIYWMFQSPKKSFQCLIYMHRYDEGTIGTILTSYLRPFEDKLRNRLQVLELSNASPAVNREADKIREMITELEQWERDVIYPLAHERVAIDLDDGVKINYNKFPKALAKVTGLSKWR